MISLTSSHGNRLSISVMSFLHHDKTNENPYHSSTQYNDSLEMEFFTIEEYKKKKQQEKLMSLKVNERTLWIAAKNKWK